MNEHQTPLSIHLKEKHLWKDLFFLFALWSYVIFVESNSQFFLIKLMALVASLEFLSFLSFHLFGKEKSLLLQGFLGGLISSTTVFIQLNFDEKFSQTDNFTIARSMLLAICAMIIECMIILIAYLTHIPSNFILPFTIYLIIILGSIFFLKIKSKNNSKPIEEKIHSLAIDDPINWINVFKFASYVALLKYLFSLSQEFPLIPKKLGVFLASLFEAHAVLAVSLLERATNAKESELFIILILILAGSTLSKLYFVLKGSVLKTKRLVILPMFIALLFSILTFYFVVN